MMARDSLLTAVISLCFCALVSAEKFKSEERSNLQSKQTENADFYDCVHIYRQPAFNHPLLKDHVLQWNPTVVPTASLDTDLLHEAKPTSSNSNDARCPKNYIPMLRKKLPTQKIVNHTNLSNYSIDNLYQFAILRMIHRPNQKYFGGQARIGINNPNCGFGQNSGSSIWIGSDLSDQKNFIKAGWMVDPDGYGDAKTRLSTYWTADGYHKTGCYDLQCPGFIQINNYVTLGAAIGPLSTFGGTQYDIILYIFQDIASKHWWLTFSDGRQTLHVGYWPRELFPLFGDGGTVLHFGGQTMTQPELGFPPMGFGVFPDGDYAHSGFFRHILYVNNSNYLVRLPSGSAEVYTDNPNCYVVTSDEDGGDQFGHSLLFGGPGGAC